MAFRTTVDTHRAAAAVLADLARMKIDLPPGIAKAATEANAATAGLNDLARELDADKCAAILTATLDGKTVPAETLGRAVAALLTERPNVTHTITYQLAGAVVRAIRDEADALIAALRPRFDAAAADLDDAAEVLQGVDDLSNLESVTRLGGNAAAAWQSAKAAEAVITSTISIVQRLGMARAYDDVNDPRDRLLAVADLALPGYKKVNAQTTPWALRQLGPLALATPAEHQKRKAKIDEQWATDAANPATRLGPGVGGYPASNNPAAFGQAAAL